MNSKQRRFIKRSKRMNRIKLGNSLRQLKAVIREQKPSVAEIVDVIDALIYEIAAREIAEAGVID